MRRSQHYGDVLASLRAHDLEPMVTVTHFSLPTWVHDPITTRALAQLGLPAPAAGLAVAIHTRRVREVRRVSGMEVRRSGRQLGDHQRTVPAGADTVPGPAGSGSRPRPPGPIRPDLASTFLVNQAKGHVAAYDAIHKWDTEVATEGQPKAFVGFTNNMVPARPANPVNPLDVQAADAWNQTSSTAGSPTR